MGDVIQGSESWFDVRRGLVTASRIPDVISKTKTGWGSGRKNYMAQLIAETLTDTTAESYTNAAMQHGIDTEPKARTAYEFHTDSKVEEIGFVKHPILKSGASPDGLVNGGLIEIKCPNTATHITIYWLIKSRRSMSRKCSGSLNAPAENGVTSYPTIPGCQKK